MLSRLITAPSSSAPTSTNTDWTVLTTCKLYSPFVSGAIFFPFSFTYPRFALFDFSIIARLYLFVVIVFGAVTKIGTSVVPSSVFVTCLLDVRIPSVPSTETFAVLSVVVASTL